MAVIAADKLVIRETGAGAAVSMLRHLYTLPGVRITLVGGLNGVGLGLLRYDGAGYLSWQAPGSISRGANVDVSGGGAFVLYDGADGDKWLAVHVTVARLPGSYQARRLRLLNEMLNPIAPDELSIGAGIETWTVELYNDAGQTLENITAWLDPDTPENRELDIQWGLLAGWVRPWNETEGRSQFGERTLNAAASKAFWFRRTVADVAAAHRTVRGWLSFDDSEGGRARVEFRGGYRVYDDAVYEAYQDDAANPVPGVDSPLDTSSTVPWTPGDTFGDATHRLALVEVNRFGLRSSPEQIVRKRIVSGQEAGLDPTPPAVLRIIPLAGGNVRVLARYPLAVDADRRASEFAIWYTTDGSPPSASGEPDFVRPVRIAAGGCGILDLGDIPAQGDGTAVKVLVATRLAGVLSATYLTSSHTIALTGPSVPPGGELVQ